jgi:hypothetical protein
MRESPAIIDQKSANSRISHRVIRSGFPMHRCRTNQAAIVKQKLDFARPSYPRNPGVPCRVTRPSAPAVIVRLINAQIARGRSPDLASSGDVDLRAMQDALDHIRKAGVIEPNRASAAARAGVRYESASFTHGRSFAFGQK